MDQVSTFSPRIHVKLLDGRHARGRRRRARADPRPTADGHCRRRRRSAGRGEREGGDRGKPFDRWRRFVDPPRVARVDWGEFVVFVERHCPGIDASGLTLRGLYDRYRKVKEQLRAEQPKTPAEEQMDALRRQFVAVAATRENPFDLVKT